MELNPILAALAPLAAVSIQRLKETAGYKALQQRVDGLDKKLSALVSFAVGAGLVAVQASGSWDSGWSIQITIPPAKDLVQIAVNIVVLHFGAGLTYHNMLQPREERRKTKEGIYKMKQLRSLVEQTSQPSTGQN